MKREVCTVLCGLMTQKTGGRAKREVKAADREVESLCRDLLKGALVTTYQSNTFRRMLAGRSLHLGSHK